MPPSHRDAAVARRCPARPSAKSTLTAAALVGWFVVQCCWFIGTQSLTYDEPVHVIAGLNVWRHGRYDEWNDQPPLGRLLLTAPLLVSDSRDWQLENRGPSGANFWVVSIRPDPLALAWRTRSVNVALGALLGVLLWTTARRLFGEGAAHVALALFACSPPVIAQFSVATVDGIATLFCLATAVAVARWRARPSWPATLAAGGAMGGFLLSKFSAPPLVMLALGAMLIGPPEQQSRARTAKTIAAAAVAALLVWSAYGWHVGPVSFRSGSLGGPYGRERTVVVPIEKPHLDLTVSVPAPEYVSALSGVLQHSVRGQPAFLLGEVRRSGGWRRYYPIVVLLKWPPATWLLAGTAIVLIARRRIQAAGDLPLFVLFPTVLFGLAMLSNLDIGDRYVLPVYPFVLVFGGAAWTAARSRPTLRYLVLGLVALQGVDALRFAPDYLSYMTPFVKPDQSHTLLSDSNLDWGQGLLALRDYQRAHPDRAISLAYFGGVDPGSYGIRVRRLGEDDRASGTVVVSATHLSGQYLRNRAAYRWLLRYPRQTILNHTLHVFEVP